MTEQGDPVEFLGWLVNTLHRDLGGTKKRVRALYTRRFQGKVQMRPNKSSFTRSSLGLSLTLVEVRLHISKTLRVM